MHTCTTSMSGSPTICSEESKALSAPRAAAAARALSGVEALTPDQACAGHTRRPRVDPADEADPRDADP